MKQGQNVVTYGWRMELLDIKDKIHKIENTVSGLEAKFEKSSWKLE